MRKILSLLFLLGFMSSAFADEEFYGKIESMPENSFEGEPLSLVTLTGEH